MAEPKEQRIEARVAAEESGAPAEEARLPAEPFRIKMVEPIRMTDRSERARLLTEAGLNPFLLKSDDVYVDLLTDSGTSAMSDRQWGALMTGDEAYAGSRSFLRFKEVVERVFGFPYVIPTHQGRGAENVLFTAMVKEGQYILNNMHFDTTKAHVQHKKGRPVDLAVSAAYNPSQPADFKGNMDLGKLEDYIRRVGPEQIALIMATVTNNGAGGQPVSMQNLRGIREIADRYRLPFFIDACRLAENAYFIKQREPGYENKPVREIVREMMDLADGCTMSAKKDALVNIGGFLALRDPALYQKATVWAVLFEGFPTYGGLAGRDLEAMAVGLEEVLDENYLAHRIGQVAFLGNLLREAGVPIVEPTGGHAVYIDARAFLPHIPQSRFPAWALTCQLYLEGGVRTVEIGTVLSGRNPETGDHDYPGLEMVRLAIPRRVYTDRHLAWVAETAIRIYQRREAVRGLEFTYEPPILRHFTARFEWTR
jgi:tyrosine phenol-lyase